ncbi:MAG: hypothetical protein IPM81_12005 [Saprospirales bacterium]|nr:hypothetical protein [Saprospirales bacterium]
MCGEIEPPQNNLEERSKLLNVIEEYPIEVLPVEKMEGIGSLAQVYLDTGIMPPKKLFDALHVAFCVVTKIHPLRISTPTELAGYGN